MNVSDPLKPKRRRANSDSPPHAQDSEPPAPANDAGASVFGVPLDDEALVRCAKLPAWTAEEAAYFSAGCERPFGPLAVPTIGFEGGWLNTPVLYRQALFERHLHICASGTHIAPPDALDLLQQKEEWVHPKMLEAVTRFHAPKKLKWVGNAKPRLGDYMSEDDEDDERPEALKRKLSTARKIIFGFSMGKLGHNPRSLRNSTSKVIAGIMEGCDLDCDEDTIRRHLKAGQEEHWVDPNL